MKEVIPALYRTVIFSLAVYAQVKQQINVCVEASWNVVCFSRLKYLSNQGNWLAIIWLGLYLYSYLIKDKELENKLYGVVRGAIVVYLTIIWLAYHFLLSGEALSGWSLFTNIIAHYFVPITMLVDWFITEKEKYNIGFIKKWIIYPFFYAIFAIINGLAGWEKRYIYPFLDVDNNGWGNVLVMIGGIFVLFFVISFILIGYNKKFRFTD